MNAEPNFDRIARWYQVLEYLTLGRWLERTRFHFLPRIHSVQNALVLGDGDGRFLARLLNNHSSVHATAVDTSAVMLDLLSARCRSDAVRLHIVHENVLDYVPDHHDRYDLVVTHFFLDCLTEQQVNQLVEQLAPVLSPNAIWLFSDFQIPPGKLTIPAKLLVRSLYLAFRLLTRLDVTALPDHASAFKRAGLVRSDQQKFLGGILVTELWKADEPKYTN